MIGIANECNLLVTTLLVFLAPTAHEENEGRPEKNKANHDN